jgi:hypothetical protein
MGVYPYLLGRGEGVFHQRINFVKTDLQNLRLYKRKTNNGIYGCLWVKKCLISL